MKTITKLLPILGLVTVGGLMASAPDGGESHGDAEATARDARDAAPFTARGTRAGPSGACAMPVGTRLGYDVTTKTQTVVDMSSLLGEVESSDPRVGFSASPAIDRAGERAWHVDLQVVAHEAATTVLAAHIDAGDVILDGRERRRPTAELAATFLVRLDARCAIEEFGWHGDADRQAAHEQQALMAALSFVAPPEPGVAHYLGRSFDAAGYYEAQFEAAGDDVVEGTISSYDEAFAAGPGGVDLTLGVDSSAMNVALADGGWFSELTHARALTVTARGQEIGTLQARTHAVAGAPSGWTPDVVDVDEGWRWGLLLGRRVAEPSPKGDFDHDLVGVGMDLMLAKYVEAYQGGAGRQASEFLTQWLRANPEATGELLAALRSGDLDDTPAYGGVFLALGMADTPQCHEALVALVAESGERGRDAISAAHAMSMVASPNEDMVAAMAQVSTREGIYVGDRSSVAMAMGTFAAENEQRAPELAAQARAHIREALLQPGDTDELAGSLYAAGNSGHDELLGAVRDYLDHDDPEVRRHATHALRNMSPDEVYPHLESGLADESPGVRVEALQVATAVSREGKAAPPATLVDEAIGLLHEGAGQAERHAALGLLGQASRHGSDAAASVLVERFEETMLSEDRDLEQLQALGRHANVRWTADD